MSKEKHQLAEKLAKRNPKTYYKGDKPKNKKISELTKKEKEIAKYSHAKKVIDEESKADYSWMKNPYKKKKLIYDDPKDNQAYLTDVGLSKREGSFARGALVKFGKPKIAKKGWR
tara:strand:+ start:78 stop:422 length:345 start_codon:yes stop_codon:yes gene_type:complete